jgi:transposase
LEETTICVVDESGRIVKEARAQSEPEALSEALRGVDLPLERIGLEACSLTAWLHDGLRDEGLATICIETRQANAAMKTMPNKTDRNDARALARRSYVSAGTGRCMSRAGNAGCGAPF